MTVSIMVVSAADVFAQQKAVWLADVDQPQWWTTVTVAGDRSPMTLPPGNPTPPQPAVSGCFHRAEFRTFLAYPLLNHRNAIRLLGPPTTSRAVGNAWLIEWQRPEVVEVVPSANPTASIDAQFSGLRVTIRLQGKSFTWERVALNGRVLAVEEITL